MTGLEDVSHKLNLVPALPKQIALPAAPAAPVPKLLVAPAVAAPKQAISQGITYLKHTLSWEKVVWLTIAIFATTIGFVLLIVRLNRDVSPPLQPYLNLSRSRGEDKRSTYALESSKKDKKPSTQASDSSRKEDKLLENLSCTPIPIAEMLVSKAQNWWEGLDSKQQEKIKKLYEDMGPYVQAKLKENYNLEWLKYHRGIPEEVYLYILANDLYPKGSDRRVDLEHLGYGLSKKRITVEEYVGCTGYTDYISGDAVCIVGAGDYQQ